MTLHRMAAPWAMIAALALGGCATISESRLNPLNWGRGGEEAETARPVVRADPRPLLPEVASLVADPTPGGIILRATARAPAGTWDVALLPAADATEGVLAYRLVGWQPSGRERSASSPPSSSRMPRFRVPGSKCRQPRAAAA